MARQLASAWVSVSPTGFTDFGRQAKSGIEKALKAVSGKVAVDADTKPALTDLDKLKARLAEFSRTVAQARVGVDDKQAAATLARMQVNLDKLGHKVASPRITLEGIARADAELLGFEAALDRVNAKAARTGSAGLLAGAGASLGGLGAGAGLLAAGSGALALASPLAAAATAMAAFAAVAIPTLKTTLTAASANSKAQDTYNNSIAKAKQVYAEQLASAKTAQQRQAAGVQLSKAEAAAQLTLSQNTTKLSGGQQQLASQVAQLSASWSKLETSLAPVVVSVAALAVKIANDFMPLLGPLVTAGGKVITAFLAPLDSLVKSADFSKIITAFTQFGVQAAKLAGPQLVQLVKVLLQLFVQVMPAGVKILGDLLPAIVSMVTEAAPVVTLIANWTAAALDWLNKNKLLVPSLWGLVAVVTALKLGLLANPIGIVITALALLTVAFITAWKSSSTFRQVIKDIGAAVLQMGILVLQGAKAVGDGFLTAIKAVIHAAANVATALHLPFAGALRSADTDLGNWKSSFDKSMGGAIGTLQKWQDELLNSGKASKNTADTIVGAFQAQGRAAGAARKDVGSYTDAIINNGAGSDKANSARNRLIKDMEKAGVNAATANKDVANYTVAVVRHGAYSDQARAARQRLNNDIETAFKNSRQGKTDLGNFTNAVTHHSSQSDAVRSARQRLINDLIHAGINAGTARTDVNNLQTAINKMHGKGISISMAGNGYYTIKENGQNFNISAGGLFSPHAMGGYIQVGSGPTSDDVPILASRGEYVVKAASVAKYGKHTMDAINAGRFASGGPVSTGAAGIARMYRDEVNDEGYSLTQAMRKSLKSAEQAFTAAHVPNVGSGVARWLGVVLRALALNHEPSSLAKQVLFQISTESGGNPNAINLSDINAQHGDPSRGLLQTIGATFRAYHIPGTSWNIYDPLANVAAAINYARHVYGPSLMRGGAGLGSGHGYAGGGLVADQGTVLSPGWNLRWNGLGRPEPLVPAGSGGVHLHLTVTGPVGSQRELEDWFVRTANQTARTGRLTQAVKRAGGG